jgi:hypothetical protein
MPDHSAQVASPKATTQIAAGWMIAELTNSIFYSGKIGFISNNNHSDESRTLM